MSHFFVFCFSLLFIYYLPAASNNYQDLLDKGLIKKQEKPALHLGCGESYLPGHINIDLPFADRPLHVKNGPDYFYNILDLRFPMNSISKIENHHMFEHFSRPVSLALLCAWYLWLDINGEIVIETPDFEGITQRYLETSSFSTRQVIIRHLFGSHEASWAYHYDGWSHDKFAYILSELGFRLEDSHRYSWNNLDNIIIKARKARILTLEQIKQTAYAILQLSCVDRSESEYKMWQGWCQEFDRALSVMICDP